MGLDIIKNFLQSQRLKHIILFVLCLTLIILSFLNLRSETEKDDDKIKNLIKTINTCSWIIIILSLMVLIRSSYIFYTIRTEGSYEESVYSNYILLSIPSFIFIVCIIQKFSISSILPDMNNKKAVDEYNNSHTLKAEDVKGSSDVIFYISLVLFLMSVLYIVYYKYYKKDEINITKETPYDKVMKLLREQLEREENEFNTALQNKSASEAWLEDRQQEIERLKISLLSLKAKREQNVQQETRDITKKLNETTSMLSNAQERTLDEARVMSEGTVNIDNIVPVHLKKNAQQPTLFRSPKIVLDSKSSQSQQPTVGPSTSQKTSFNPVDLEKAKKAVEVLEAQQLLEQKQKRLSEISSGKSANDISNEISGRFLFTKTLQPTQQTQLSGQQAIPQLQQSTQSTVQQQATPQSQQAIQPTVQKQATPQS